ncbi:nicotinate-nucleotide adenylyltransferase [Ornithinibacillus scapharcae]|uniref:nicotinate-nucleotide adenylyltransferase n=1 Tax=Ornithinibacillus scapharcae TaxID=1147159 RepID=UPI000225B7CE|nr:nicotinate-nucleotide adenylyltransferase [Ornithinibacillus scapharcae]
MSRIGLLGGTFDPPHIGHLIIAQEVCQALKLDKVWFIPTYEPPHKNTVKVDATKRVELLKLAIKDNLSFAINTIEIDRAGKSYTIDTINILKEMYPETDFYFIIGADMVEYLPNWYKINELIDFIQFVGVKRPGYKLVSNYPIVEVDVPMVDVSSTIIRERIQRNESIQYLVPDCVHTYIKERGLYE